MPKRKRAAPGPSLAAKAQAEGSGICYWWLDEKWNPVPVKNVIEWALKFEVGSRVLRYSKVGRGEAFTVFIGVDLGFSLGQHPPILWETVVRNSGPELDGVWGRYPTKELAIDGHMEVSARMFQRWKEKHPKIEPIVRDEMFLHWPFGKTLAQITGRK